MVIIKGPFVSSPEWPGTVPGLEPFHTLYWAGNVPNRSRPGMSNRTGPKVEQFHSQKFYIYYTH